MSKEDQTSDFQDIVDRWKELVLNGSRFIEKLRFLADDVDEKSGGGMKGELFGGGGVKRQNSWNGDDQDENSSSDFDKGEQLGTGMTGVNLLRLAVETFTLTFRNSLIEKVERAKGFEPLKVLPLLSQVCIYKPLTARPKNAV